ncbi:MAG TPA: NADH:flavin oxidoreductase [Solirubrobacterales bacterium]|nr:NADH:flavin oxidoreductase [Solirubrobacterales bacterium]
MSGGGGLFEPGRIGGLEVRNRFVRAGTSESMADADGRVTPQLVELYSRLGRHDVGLVMTGHLFCDARGRYAPAQVGIHEDAMVPGLAELASAVKATGARVFAQVAHAGSQSRAFGVEPLAPSPVPNALTGRMVEEATAAQIEAAIAAFAAGARRAVEAGFDGVHVHGANGYLISEFCSPLANRREDEWGGDAERRGRFLLAVIKAIRDAVPSGFPVTLKLGIADAEPGLTAEETLARCPELVAAGLDAIEVSVNVMVAPSDSAKTYVAVGPRRAAEDLLVHRLLAEPRPEAYFDDWARRLRQVVDTKVILVGGLRTTQTMAGVIEAGDADFIAMARPFIREPDLVSQIAAGRTGRVDCTSCNLCLRHEGHHSLRCWRTPRRRLLQHAVYRLTGGLGRGLLRTRN